MFILLFVYCTLYVVVFADFLFLTIFMPFSPTQQVASYLQPVERHTLAPSCNLEDSREPFLVWFSVGKIKDKIMYKLVQYIEDGIFHVCHSSNINRNKKKLSAKYSDGHFYICNIICSNPEKNILEEFRKNVILGIPRVLLQNICQKGSVAEPSYEIVTKNTEMAVENSEKYQSDDIHGLNEERQMNEMETSDINRNGSVAEPSYEIVTKNTEMAVENSEKYQSDDIHGLNEERQMNEMETSGINRNGSVAEQSYEIVTKNTEMAVENSEKYQSDGIHGLNEERQMNEMETSGINRKGSVAEPSYEIVTKNTEMAVENSEKYQSDDIHGLNEERQMNEMETSDINRKNNITVHQMINVNEWYDCIIEPEIDPDNDVSDDNLVLQTHSDNNNDENGMSCTITPTGEDTADKVRTIKSSHKQHACFYCKKKVFQISRHLLNVHSKETEIQLIKQMNAGNPQRRSKLNSLRSKGDFEYNKIHDDCIVVRKTTKIDDDASNENYVPCPSCWGYFIKNNLRHHKSRCSPHKCDRQLQGNARKLLNHIHNRASDKLRNFVVPDMYHDEIMKNILFDEVLILYGNYLCVKYTQDHLKNHVRAQLRLLGRLMLQAKLHNSSITCCKDLMQSIHCDTVRKAIDDVSGLDPTRGIYKHPFNGRTLGTAIQKIIGVIKSESIKTRDNDQLQICESFLQVYKIDVAPYLNRICALSEKKQKRIKHAKVKLPGNDDIQQYFKYLLESATLYQKRLENKFSVADWKNLAQYLLVALAVFNCKRPGETQRLELEDFHSRQGIGQKELNSLEPDDQLQADKYVRVGFGGKLGNATALLIDKEKILPGLLLIVKYRDKAGVHRNNQYLFGAPSFTDENRTFSTYLSHQLFLSKSGMDPTSLSFTNLRYHLATEVSKGCSSQEEELRVSNYMSHDYNIHKNIYDQSAVVMDITRVSKHLEANAMVTEKKHSSTIISAKKITQDSNSDDMNSSNSLRSCKRKRRNNDYPKRRKKSEDEYHPDSSEERALSDADSEPDAKEVEFRLGKLQHRVSWTPVEKNVTRKYFQEELDNKKTLNPEKVKTFKYKYGDLMKNRTIPMIKQWIQMEKKKLHNKSLGFQEIKPRYSTPEREVLECNTEKFSLSGSEPSLQELEEIIEMNPILKRRSAISLLAKFRHSHKNKNKRDL